MFLRAGTLDLTESLVLTYLILGELFVLLDIYLFRSKDAHHKDWNYTLTQASLGAAAIALIWPLIALWFFFGMFAGIMRGR